MKKLYSLIALALTVSLFIYLFYRSEKTIVNQFAVLLLSRDVFENLRFAICRGLPLNESIVYSLPGGLWVFCTTILARDHYFKIRHHEVRIVNIPISFAVGLELFQLLHLTNGTFDSRDLGFYLAFWLLAVYSYETSSAQKDVLAPFSLNTLACVACFVSVYLAHVSQ